MIAVVAAGDPMRPCVVQWCGKSGLLGVGIRTWCGGEYGIGEGIFQVPDGTPACARCLAAIAQVSPYEHRVIDVVQDDLRAVQNRLIEAVQDRDDLRRRAAALEERLLGLERRVSGEARETRGGRLSDDG